MIRHPILSFGQQGAAVEPPVAGGGAFVQRSFTGRGSGRAWAQRSWADRETIVEPGQTDQDDPTDGGI